VFFAGIEGVVMDADIDKLEHDVEYANSQIASLTDEIKDIDGCYHGNNAIELAYIDMNSTLVSSHLKNGEKGLVVSARPELVIKDSQGNVTINDDVDYICSSAFLYGTVYYKVFSDIVNGVTEWFFVEYDEKAGYNNLKSASVPLMETMPDYSQESWDWSKDVNGRYTIMQQVYDYLDALMVENPTVMEKYDPMATQDYEEDGVTIRAMPKLREWDTNPPIIQYMINHGYSQYPFWYNGISEGDYDITVGSNIYHAHLKATPKFKTFVYKLSKKDIWYSTRSNSKKIARRTLYIQAGVHGDENMGPVATAHLVKELLSDSKGAYSVLANYDVYILPVLDGYNSLHGSYNGAYGTNANRNYPTPWWREEDAAWGLAAGDYFVTRLACAFIDVFKPDVAFDVHDQTAAALDSQGNYFHDFGYFCSGLYNTCHQMYQTVAEILNVVRNTQRFEQYFGTKNQIPQFSAQCERMNAAHAHDYFFYKNMRTSGLMELPSSINWVAQQDGSCISQRVTENDYNVHTWELAALILINFTYGMCEYNLITK
jgi:hypothetical protein